MSTAAFISAVCNLLACAASFAATVTIREDNVFLIDGRPAFPIGFTKAPPPDAKTPAGADAWAELAKNGDVFHRCGPNEADLPLLLDRSAAAGILCAAYLPRVPDADWPATVKRYKDHPALGYWKGADEPESGKVPVEKVERFYRVVHENDPRHPVWITQAPRGTIASLKRYDKGYDIAAIDIYPIGYPPGTHSHLPNKNISVVGDYADWLREITGGRKPFWMVLQIAWSGVVKPGKTLRFPTFAEERYMTYQSMIKGARGLAYFGGDVAGALNERDRALGWNWTFYEKVLHPVLEELNPKGPLYPALLAPESKLPVRVDGDVEFSVREAGGRVFLLAAKREGATVEVKFSGLPAGIGSGDVLYEGPRRVTVSGGSFTDWFGPNEVHLYRFDKTVSP